VPPRRAGHPYRLRQSVLMDRLRLTSGTVSLRLTRLVAKGVVTREPDPEVARGALITLTPAGLRLFEQVGPAHLHNEDVLLSALTDDERDQLAGLLRKLLAGFERDRVTSPLGFTVAPAHLARAMRTAVGLSDTPGLLVTDVEPAGAAATAGILVGDLLVEVDGVPLRSCVTLAEHTREAAGAGRLGLVLIRDGRPLTVAVATDPTDPGSDER
jgi:DNA-binding MarR family transcriptional regulator